MHTRLAPRSARPSCAMHLDSVTSTEVVLRTSSCGGLAVQPRISGVSLRSNTYTFDRCYMDTVRSGRFQGTLRRTLSFFAVPVGGGTLPRVSGDPIVQSHEHLLVSLYHGETMER